MSDTCSNVQGYVDPNWPRPDDDGSSCIIIYGYVPSFALGVLGVVLFTTALVAHSYLLSRYRTWYFSTVIVGTVMEIIGYIFRILASKKNPYSVAYFVGQYFCIVVAPVFYSAAIYTLITPMTKRIGREYAPLSPKVILWTFIICDIIATTIQMTGAGLIGRAYSDGKDPTTPNNILLAGLAFQVFSFAVFIFCLLFFLVRSRNTTDRHFKIFSTAVLVATLAVYLRTCIRLAETAEGLLEFLSTHEAIFGCLEFLPIVIAVYIFVYWHPGRWLGSESIHKKTGKSELEVSQLPR
ncbi:hypothetical protein LTR70_010562 [Exophiala xenobiotica]|uniref:RTA1 like protein n=1 Tax=Lithohypha guttulata TaxID=1690604 RepID=A0ABR0JV94_9EURO|nr:hypothetical protein LTR24_010512 [Lithohypha guttulata]KAK5309153.1 hypothetical protein LTR70_010562 [Exophiala xenobiotica]